MIDYSFLRLKPTLNEAKELQQSKVVDLEYLGQVHLKPNERYLQISNSDIPIVFSDVIVYVVDWCGNSLAEITQNVFYTNFSDTNGISQVAFEIFNIGDYGAELVSLKFVEQSNENTWFTNFFVSSDIGLDYTSRFDYKNNTDHYGTQYSRAPFFQSIRLTTYFNRPINESEREEYHQISTDITISSRNIDKRKHSFILHEFEYFSIERLEKLITNDLVYVDGSRYYSSTAIDYPEREGDSNMFEGEMLLNPTDETRTFEPEIFEGIQFSQFNPFGNYITGSSFNTFSFKTNYEGLLKTGTIQVFNSSNVLQHTFTEADIVYNNKTSTMVSTGTPVENPSNDSYYVVISEGLFEILGIENEQNSDWNFTLLNGDYDSADYSNDYLTL